MHVIDSDRFVIPSEQTSTSAKNADGVVYYFRDHCIGARAICLFFSRNLLSYTAREA